MGPKITIQLTLVTLGACTHQLESIVWVHFKNVCVFGQSLCWILKGIQELITDGVCYLNHTCSGTPTCTCIIICAIAMQIS
jgi:hypothetical protein